MNKKPQRKPVRKQKSHHPRRKPSPPRTAEQYFAKSPREQDLWDRIVSVHSKMRSGASLQEASREIGIAPKTVIRWSGKALRRASDGRYTPKRSDRLLRVLMLPFPDGVREVAIIGSRQATTVGEYWNEVHRVLEIGDESGLRKFRGKKVTDANGNKVLLITDLAELRRLGLAGELSFESLYARSM